MNQKPSPLHRASEWIVDHYRLFFVVFAALLVFSAVASGWVKVENDVAAYLPADSETRQGLDIMEQEFQTYGSAKILLRDTDADAAAATAEQIRAVDGVDSCTYTMNDTGSALLSVSLSDLEGSDTCAQTVQALRDLLDGSGAYIYSAEGYSISDQINGEVRGLLVIVAIILVTVLTFTSSTYAEVPILLITFLAAALINKGTNFVFGTISFVSNAVAILLQLAMSVDYAIIFCNRYKQAHETLPVREAVIESLEKSITVISSSSLTTIAGLVAMTFMKFGLGRDLGIVLIKAILISMLTVFLLMPGLLLKLGPAMDKTKHRNFVPKISGVGRLAWRTRRVVPLVFAAVLVVACIGANRVSYVYSEAPLKTHNADVNRTASQAITDDFGDETVLAVVVPAGDYTQEAALLDGAGHLSVLLRVYVPLSKPSIATVTLFSMVGHWNSWFDGMIYLRDDTLQPLATLLHNMVSRTTLNVIMETTDISVIEQLLTVTNESLKSAQLFIGMLPILCVYPFIQKYFTKGLVIGSVKG